MASAQTEPSMDEILASIRRIISEEDEAPAEVPVRRKLETLQLRDKDEAVATSEAPKPRLRQREPEAQVDAEPDVDDLSDHEPEALAQQEAPTDELDDFEPMPEDSVHGVATMEPAADAHDHGDVHDDTFDEEAGAEPAMTTNADPAAASEEHEPEETRNMSNAAAVQAVSDAIRPRVMADAANKLTVSEATAGQAASAFGALEENMRLSTGSGRTIEDLIEGMLAPMLTAWLDENLPRIVEDKVEEEVRRISRRR